MRDLAVTTGNFLSFLPLARGSDLTFPSAARIPLAAVPLGTGVGAPRTISSPSSRLARQSSSLASPDGSLTISCGTFPLTKAFFLSSSSGLSRMSACVMRKVAR